MKKDLATELLSIMHKLAPGHEVLEMLTNGGSHTWTRWLARAILASPEGHICLSSYTSNLPVEGTVETPIGFGHTTHYLAPNAEGAPRITRPEVAPSTFIDKVTVQVTFVGDRARVVMMADGNPMMQDVPAVYTDDSYVLNVDWPQESGVHGNIRLPEKNDIEFSVNIIPQYPVHGMLRRIKCQEDIIVLMEKYGTIDMFYFSDSPEESLAAVVLAVLRQQEGGAK